MILFHVLEKRKLPFLYIKCAYTNEGEGGN